MMVGALIMLFFFGMVQLGSSKHQRLKRADRYIQLCGSKMYAEIAQLAAATQASKGWVLRDVRRMLRLGIFPQGHLDEQGTTLMLNDVIYRQYQDAERSRHLREREALPAPEERPLTPGELVEREQQARMQELNQMVAEGMECIRKLRDSWTMPKKNSMISAPTIMAGTSQINRVGSRIIPPNPMPMPPNTLYRTPATLPTRFVLTRGPGCLTGMGCL